jgi:hypothetical protein
VEKDGIMDEFTFSRLFAVGSGVSFPVLIELRCPGLPTWFFTSNAEDVFWEGVWYTAVPMSYKFPTAKNGVPQGGALEIDINIQNEKGDELLKWFDELDHRATVDVVGLIDEQGEIEPISQITQSHGNVSWDGGKITWTLGADDRLNMQVNPWVADNDFLTG